MTQPPALDYEDFSGGMADLSSPNDRKTANLCQNFDITIEKKLRERAGSHILDNTSSLIATSAGGVRENGRTGSIFNYEEDLHLVLRSKGALYAKNAASWDATTAWTKLSSINTGFEAIASYRDLTAAAIVSKILYKGQLLLVGKDESSSDTTWVTPTKVFLDSTNTFQARRASLPKPNDPLGFLGYSRLLASCIASANALKTAFLTHIADTTAHAYSTTTISSSSATDEASLCTLVTELVARYNEHVIDTPVGLTAGAHRWNQPDTGVQYKMFGAFTHLGIGSLFSAVDCYQIINRLTFGFNLHNIGFVYTANGEAISQGDAVTWDTTADTATFANSSGFRESTMRTGDPLHFTGTMPTGLVARTTYFAINSGLGSIKLATTVGNAKAGISIDISGSPSGCKAYVHPANLHPKYTAQASVGYDPNIVGCTVNPACTSLFAQAISQAYATFTTHLTTSYHAHDPLKGYLLTATTMGNDANTPLQNSGQPGVAPTYLMAQAVAYAYKMHWWFLQHRLEQSGEYHGSGVAENAGTKLSHIPSEYGFTSIPDINDATFVNIVFSIYKDLADHLYGTNPSDTPSITGHVTYGATRHTAAWSEIFSGYVLQPIVYSNVQAAFVATYKYTTYENKSFEDISAPLVSDSFIWETVNTWGTPGIEITTYALVQKLLIYNDSASGAGFFVPRPYYLNGYGALPSVPAVGGVDSSNVTIEVYRTIENGNVFYLNLSYLNNSTVASISDPTSDAALQALGETLYTTGGVVDNDEIPRASCIARVADTIYVGNIVEDGTPKLFNTVSFTYATPGTVNATAHGLSNGEQVTFFPKDYTHNLPTEITGGGKPLFIINATTDTYQLALTRGGSAITLTDPGSVLAYFTQQMFTKYPKRVRQSNIASTFSSTSNFFADSDSDVICIGTAQQYGVVVCRQGVFRIENKFTDDGQGSMVLERISDRVGGVSANGGITVNSNYYFMGFDGFYMTDGFTVTPISPHLKQAHKSIVDQNVAGYSARNAGVQCEYDRIENRIIWAVNRGNSDYNTENWVLHLNHSEIGRGSFTNHNGSTQYYPTAITYFRAQLIRGDTQGFVFAHSDTYYNDPKINRASTGSLVSGVGVAIPYQYRSLAEDFGNKNMRKLVSKALIQMDNNGNLTMAVRSINDKNASYIASMKGIRYRGEYTGLIKERRTFPVPTSQGVSYQGTKCYSKQVDCTPGTDTLYKSDDYATATLASGTLTLTSGNWPTPDGGIEDFSIYFETDAYATGYTVSGVSGNHLTVATPPADFSGKKWILKGVPKDERAQFQAISLYHQPIDAQPTPPTGASTGNA